MPHWSAKSKSKKVAALSVEQQANILQQEIVQKLTLMHNEVVQLRGDTEELKQTLDRQSDIVAAQDNVILSLEQQLHRLDKSDERILAPQWAHLKSKLQKLFHINKILTSLVESNYLPA